LKAIQKLLKLWDKLTPFEEKTFAGSDIFLSLIYS